MTCEQYYIGDKIFMNTSGMSSITLYFTGCEKTENHWKVNFAFMHTNGYAGHGCNMTLTAREGDPIRFGKGYKIYSSKDNKRNKKVLKEFINLQIDHMDPDSITLSFL